MILGRASFWGVIALLLTTVIQASAQGCLPTVVLGQNLTICQGTSLTLNATNPNATYLWQDGSTNPTFTASTSGLYWVVVTNSCGSASDSVNINVLPAPNAQLGPDTFLCVNQSMSIGPAGIGPNVNAIWSTGATTPSITINQAGTYWLTLNNLCGQSTDTIHISSLNAPVLDLGPDRVLCNGTTGSLSVNIPAGHSLVWNNNGSTAGQFTYNLPGVYSATLSNACGSSTDQITVFAEPPIDFLPDVEFICNASGTAVLNPNLIADSYLWSTGSTASSITVNQPGTYWMQYTNACGTQSDTVQVLPEPAVLVNLGLDRIVCDSVNLSVNAPAGVIVLWSDGSTGNNLKVESSDTIWVEVSTGCSIIRDTVVLRVADPPQLPANRTLYRCPGQNLPFSLTPQPYTNYVWPQLGVSDSNVTFTTTGSFTVFANNICGQDSAVFTVVDSVGIGPNLGPDTTSCDRIWLKPNVNIYNSIVWNNGSTADSIRVLNGTYWVQIDNGCGVLSDTITVTSQFTPRPNLPDSLTICNGSSAQLSAPFRSFVSYLWSTGDTTASISVNQSGWVRLDAIGPCGSRSDSTYIITESFPASISADTLSICQSDTAFYTLPFSWYADSVYWSNGTNGLQLTTQLAGYHSYTLRGVCGQQTDSVLILVDLPPVEVLADTLFVCPGDSILLDATASGAEQLVWSNGDTTSSVWIDQSGWVSVQMSNACGSISEAVWVESDLPLNQLDLGRDTTVCANSFVLNSGQSAHFSHVWNNGSSTPQLTVQQSGNYWVTVSNSCQSLTDTIHVDLLQAPQLFLAPEFQFCLGSSLSVNISSPNAQYLWSTGDTTAVVSLNQPGTYWAQLNNECGSVTDTFDLVVAPPVQLNLGRDTTLCQGDSLVLDAGTDHFGRVWSTGQTSQTITVFQAGVYYVDAQGFCNTFRDSIVVSILDTPFFSLGGDPTICAVGGDFLFQGPQGMSSYLWNDGSTADTLRARRAGVYWLTVSNGCFNYTDTVQVLTEDVPIVELGSDTLLCRGIPLLLGSNGHPLEWSDGSTGVQLLVSDSGSVWARYTNSCGTFSDTIRLAYQDSVRSLFIDSLICLDDTLYFQIPEPSDTNWWGNGGTELVQRFTLPGEYPFFRANSCGVVSSTLRLTLVDCACEVYVPTAFSPNGDGINDRFRVEHACDLFGFELQIFDRWGGLVYRTTDPEFSWDGTAYGQVLPDGIYQVRMLSMVRQGETYRPSLQHSTLKIFH